MIPDSVSEVWAKRETRPRYLGSQAPAFFPSRIPLVFAETAHSHLEPHVPFGKDCRVRAFPTFEGRGRSFSLRPARHVYLPLHTCQISPFVKLYAYMCVKKKEMAI